MSCLILQTLALGNHNVEEIRELSLECLWNVFKPSSFPKARSRSSKACTACKCEVHFSVSVVDRAFTGSMWELYRKSTNLPSSQYLSYLSTVSTLALDDVHKKRLCESARQGFLPQAGRNQPAEQSGKDPRGRRSEAVAKYSNKYYRNIYKIFKMLKSENHPNMHLKKVRALAKACCCTSRHSRTMYQICVKMNQMSLQRVSA